MSPRPMRAYIVFAGSGPILLLSTYPKLTDERLVDKLRYKGIDKFIAYEVTSPPSATATPTPSTTSPATSSGVGGHAGPRLQRPPDHGQLLPRRARRPHQVRRLT